MTASPTPTPTLVPPAPTGSFVLGDSISLSVAPALSRLGYPVTGRVGQSVSTDFLRAQLSSPAAQAAPAWVIVLGTNNRGDEADVARIVEYLRAINDLRTKGTRDAKQRVYWVTPYRSPEYRGGLATHTLDAFNAELARADAFRDWFDVLDFATPADEHPEWFAQDGARLHPNIDGQAHLVNLIAGSDVEPADSPAPITDLGLVAERPEPAPEPDLTEEESFYQDFEFTNP